MMLLKVVGSLLLFNLSVNAFAQAVVSDLLVEIDGRRVQLSSMAGNGNSSGTAITGYLTNQTSAAIRIDINLSRPLFLLNSGASQNMIATQILLTGGRYSSDGRRSFITLPPRARTAVTLVAYCADFDKDNPNASDGFALSSSVPQQLVPVVGNIRAYVIANPKAEVTAAAQVAIWVAQGVSIENIRERFPVSPADEQLARRFLR